MIFGILNFHHIRHVCRSLWNIFMGKPRYSLCNIHIRRWNPRSGTLPRHHKLNRICQRRSGIFKLPILFVGYPVRRPPHARYQRYSVSKSYICLRLHHIHPLVFQSRFNAQSCFYCSSLNLNLRFGAHTSGGNCWRCCWRVAGTGFHTSYSLLAPTKKG